MSRALSTSRNVETIECATMEKYCNFVAFVIVIVRFINSFQNNVIVNYCSKVERLLQKN